MLNFAFGHVILYARTFLYYVKFWTLAGVALAGPEISGWYAQV
jgi:hypothetical protein